MTYIIVLLRTIIFYIIIEIICRYLYKKELKTLSTKDLILVIITAGLALNSIIEWQKPLMHSFIPIILLIAIKLIAPYLSRSTHQSIIINEGRINFKELIKVKYNLKDLLTTLHKKNIKTIEEVERAILHPAGSLLITKRSIK